MPAYVADLHNHTPQVIDYRGAPTTTAREIVESALGAGLDIFGVTDHFSYGFVEAMLTAASEVAAETGRELLIVPGAELRITYGPDEVHITPLFSQAMYEKALRTIFDFVGFDPGAVTAIELPYATAEAHPTEVCQRILELGGIAVVAHADRHFDDYVVTDSDIFDQLLDEPTVAGIEMLDSRKCNLLYGRSVAALGGSDSHSLSEIGRRRSMVVMRELSFAELKGALYRSSTVHLGGESSLSEALNFD